MEGSHYPDRAHNRAACQRGQDHKTRSTVTSFYRDSIIEIVMQDDFNLADLQLLFQQINSAKARELMGPPCSTRNPGPPF